jgi:hypothetical protein
MGIYFSLAFYNNLTTSFLFSGRSSYGLRLLKIENPFFFSPPNSIESFDSSESTLEFLNSNST